jgi:hypothetical protein
MSQFILCLPFGSKLFSLSKIYLEHRRKYRQLGCYSQNNFTNLIWVKGTFPQYLTGLSKLVLVIKASLL